MKRDNVYIAAGAVYVLGIIGFWVAVGYTLVQFIW